MKVKGELSQCACGRQSQFVVKVGKTRAQRSSGSCGYHLATTMHEAVPVGETADVRVTVLR